LTSLLYLPQDSWLSRQYPLTKLVFLVWAVTLAAFLPWQAASIATLILLAVAFTFRGGQTIFKRWLLAVVPLSISLLLIHGFFLHQPDLQLAGPLRVSRTGIREAAGILGHLGFLLAACLLFVSTTHPATLLKALDAKRIFPGFGYLLVSPLLLLDLFAERTRSIQAAQQTRGLSLEGPAWRRLLALPALLVPLITMGLLDMDYRSASLTGRAFRARHFRTVLDPPTDQFYGLSLRRFLLLAAAVQGGLSIWLWLK
jgi:energy-coupling factor transport system permease protein